MLALESTAATIPPWKRNDRVVVPCAISIGGVGELYSSNGSIPPSSISPPRVDNNGKNRRYATPASAKGMKLTCNRQKNEAIAMAVAVPTNLRRGSPPLTLAAVAIGRFVVSFLLTILGIACPLILFVSNVAA